MLLLLLFLNFCSAQIPEVYNCTISTNQDLGEPQPLIVNLNYTIRHPQEDDVVFVERRTDVILSCPGSHLQAVVGNQKLNFSEHEIAECYSQKEFTIGDNRTIFSNITCVEYPLEIARLTGKACENDNQEIEIGFLVNSTFIRHIRICFDNKAHATLYSHIEIEPSIRGRQSGFPRPYWINDDFYNFGANSSNKDAYGLLVNANQIATISELIGYNSTTSNPFVNNSADLYLARGHLAAKADFVFGAQQRLTFHMVNAAPQWQTFNGKNWADLEADARNLASDHNLTLQVYTGTYGVMTLPHVTTKEEIEIYLYNDEKGNQEFPAPLLYWKYLYEPITKAGIVLIGVNNPYIQNVSQAIICQDIYDSVNWTTTFTRNDVINGIMYACSPEDFRKTVPHMPDLQVKCLLTLNSTDRPSCSRSVRISGSRFTWLIITAVFIVTTFKTM